MIVNIFFLFLSVHFLALHSFCFHCNRKCYLGNFPAAGGILSKSSLAPITTLPVGHRVACGHTKQVILRNRNNTSFIQIKNIFPDHVDKTILSKNFFVPSNSAGSVSSVEKQCVYLASAGYLGHSCSAIL